MKSINEQLITAILLQEEAYNKVEKAEEVCDKEMIAFSLFCAEKANKIGTNRYWHFDSQKQVTIEELLTIYKNTLN